MFPGHIHHIVQPQTKAGNFLLRILMPGNDTFKLIKYNPLSRKRNTDTIIPHLDLSILSGKAGSNLYIYRILRVFHRIVYQVT